MLGVAQFATAFRSMRAQGSDEKFVSAEELNPSCSCPCPESCETNVSDAQTRPGSQPPIGAILICGGLIAIATVIALLAAPGGGAPPPLA